MNPPLSIELPSAARKLATQSAFDCYTFTDASNELETDLNQLTVEDLFPNGVRDRNMANCCLSGLWLLHNFLDRSHDISQEVHTPEGSFWHAIMHRLEGDFWNSKYWYRKVGNHSVFEAVEPNWDPEHYVDTCESAGNSGKSIQQTAVAEWKALFEHCFTNA